ncbi:putative membrane protein YfcA [Rhodanobacter sp. TND4EL1]
MIYAFLGALAVGISLGLLGSGGSILTVPVLVYLLHQPAKEAIAGSLAIVGAIALVGAVRYTSQGLMSWRHVLLFGLPGVVATYGGSWISQFVPGLVQLAVFAAIMGVAAWAMLRPSKLMREAGGERALVWLIAAGIGVGVVTGFVGVGGGFLLVPALVMLGGLSMHRAVATSLAVIVINSISGFYKHAALLSAAGEALNWHVIGVFILIGAGGSLVGNVVARRIPQQGLRKAFGVFLILMCGFILWRTIPGLLSHAPAHAA